MALSDKKDLHIALVVPRINSNARKILMGINRYAMINPCWHLRLACGQSYKILPSLRKSGIDGAFVSIQSEKVNSKLLEMKLPCIGIQCLKLPIGIPYLTSDSYRVAQVAAEYFIELGFRHFAYYSLSNTMWSQDRMRGFCDKLKEAGYSASVYAKNLIKDWQVGATWMKGIEEPVNWLKSLPKPVGVMACEDGVGYDLIAAAKEAGIRIPEDVAIVGVDNDEIVCDSIKPPLSSIEVNLEQAGFEAARLLNAIITGQQKMSLRPILARVNRVVTRQSSDVLAIDDAQIAAAVYFIRNNFRSKIQVSDVVNATTLSRRGLEKKFKAVLKRSIRDEITRARVEHIADLLLKSDMSIDQIAAASSFYSTSYMIRVFKQYRGVSPRIFRKMRGVV